LGREGRYIKVHPILTFMAAIPLFMAQLSALMCLRVEANLHAPVYEHTNSGRLLLGLKLIMIGLLQLTVFEYMLTAAREICFAMNPVMWIEIERPSAREWLENIERRWGVPIDESTWPGYLVAKTVRMSLSPFTVAPLAIAALFMKLAMGYLVCVDSVSLILLAPGVKNAIFDGMAITFLLELTSVWWNMLQAILSLDGIDGFQFMLAGIWTGEEKEEEAVPYIGGFLKMLFPALSQKRTTLPADFEGDMPKFVLDILQSKLCQGLRRGKGARRGELFLTFTLLFCVYAQQLQVVMFAVDTNVLPIARDVCTMWRWEAGKAQFLKKTAPLAVWTIKNMVFVDIKDELFRVLKNDTDVCLPEGKYYRMQTSDRVELFEENPIVMFGGCVLIVFVLLVPQLLHTTEHTLWDSAELSKLKNRISKDEDRITTLEKQIEMLKAA